VEAKQLVFSLILDYIYNFNIQNRYDRCNTGCIGDDNIGMVSDIEQEKTDSEETIMGQLDSFLNVAIPIAWIVGTVVFMYFKLIDPMIKDRLKKMMEKQQQNPNNQVIAYE